MARKCRHCKTELPKVKDCQDVYQKNGYCDLDHMVAHGLAKSKETKEKAERKELKARKEKLKSKGDHAREAQAQFNKFIRLRDKGLACISCGNMPNYGEYVGGSGIHAGHYRSVGACPELRFEELNVNVQCVHCNVHKSGNAIDYRIGLIKKIGIDKVEWVEGPHEPAKYSIDDLKQIKADYKAKIKELESQ